MNAHHILQDLATEFGYHHVDDVLVRAVDECQNGNMLPADMYVMYLLEVYSNTGHIPEWMMNWAIDYMVHFKKKGLKGGL